LFVVKEKLPVPDVNEPPVPGLTKENPPLNSTLGFPERFKVPAVKKGLVTFPINTRVPKLDLIKVPLIDVAPVTVKSKVLRSKVAPLSIVNPPVNVVLEIKVLVPVPPILRPTYDSKGILILPFIIKPIILKAPPFGLSTPVVIGSVVFTNFNRELDVKVDAALSPLTVPLNV
jgi:hypothetical protein